jgi:hypothetical protein
VEPKQNQPKKPHQQVINKIFTKAPKNTKRKAEDEVEEPSIKKHFLIFTFSHQEEKRNC